jgi:hypothetical protein
MAKLLATFVILAALTAPVQAVSQQYPSGALRGLEINALQGALQHSNPAVAGARIWIQDGKYAVSLDDASGRSVAVYATGEATGSQVSLPQSSPAITLNAKAVHGISVAMTYFNAHVDLDAYERAQATSGNYGVSYVERPSGTLVNISFPLENYKPGTLVVECPPYKYVKAYRVNDSTGAVKEMRPFPC